MKNGVIKPLHFLDIYQNEPVYFRNIVFIYCSCSFSPYGLNFLFSIVFYSRACIVRGDTKLGTEFQKKFPQKCKNPVFFFMYILDRGKTPEGMSDRHYRRSTLSYLTDSFLNIIYNENELLPKLAEVVVSKFRETAHSGVSLLQQHYAHTYGITGMTDYKKAY